jgi:hypothetical protein
MSAAPSIQPPPWMCRYTPAGARVVGRAMRSRIGPLRPGIARSRISARNTGAGISPVIPIGGGGKSSKERQFETADKLFPVHLTALGRWSSEVRVAKLRVWADNQYRAQNVRWERTFDEQLDYANQVLIPMLGVRIEAEYSLGAIACISAAGRLRPAGAAGGRP